MAYSSVIVLILAAGYTAGFSTRIIGGEKTTIEHYPSLLQLEYFNANTATWSQNCAATILTSRYMLSAGHCFSGSFYQRAFTRVRAGTTYRSTGGQVVYVYRELVHPSYGKIGEDGDIAVVELLGQLVYSPAVQQVTITTQGAEIPINSAVVNAGWGFIDVTGERSEELHDVTVFVADHKLCRENYEELGKHVTDNMICSGVPNVGGKAACQGDDGGPLFYGNILVGVISWGVGCADPDYPGLSTKVASYSDWIVENVV